MLSTDDKGVFGCVGLVVSMMLLIVGATISGGFVLSIMWGWFIVPLGLPPITIVHAIGLSSAVGILVRRSTMDKEDMEDMSAASKIIVALVSPFVSLLFGWLIYQFM